MIAYIRGKIEEVEADALVIDHNGVGIRVYVPATMLDGSVRSGDILKIHTFLNVREDALQLYGFRTKDELEVFHLLTGVSGIGPKVALGVLSALDVDELRFAVLSDDVKYIARAPGIGKKTAQKLILELKDKFSLEEAFEKKLSNTEEKGGRRGAAGESGASGEAEQDAVEALVALGYSNTEALQAVKRSEHSDTDDSEQILKAALRTLL